MTPRSDFFGTFIFALIAQTFSGNCLDYLNFTSLDLNSYTDFLLLQMSRVSWYKQRLKALLFKARFADKVEEIKPVRSKARYSPIGLALLL